MMIILNLLFLVFVQYCASNDRSPFDWNLRTMGHGSDDADNSKVPTFEKNGFPKKFFHTLDKTNDEENIFEKIFDKQQKDNKYEWKASNGNFKKKFDYNEKNPFYFSQKPFTKNLPDFTDNEFSKKSFHSPERPYNEYNVFEKNLFSKMDNKEEWKVNSGNFKKNFDLNEKNSFSFNRKPFINDENTYGQYKTNSIFSQNTDNDKGYPGANNYGDYEDKNANDFGSNSKYNYYKEPKIHNNNNYNHYDKDDKDLQDFNLTNNQNQDKRIDLHQDNRGGYSFLPFFSHRIKNFTSNIVCDKYNEKNKGKSTQKEGQKEGQKECPKDEQKDNDKDNEKNDNAKDTEKNDNAKDNGKNDNVKNNGKDDEKDRGKDIEKNNQKVDTAAVSNCSGQYEDIEGFVGTNLIDNTVKRCFSTEEVALLAARKDFEVSVLV